MKNIMEKLVRKIAALCLKFVPTNKPYGTELYNALNRVVPHIAMEAVLLRNNQNSGVIEVYLTKRSDNETSYPGEYHCPGSTVRNGENWRAVADRLGKNEFNAKIKCFSPLYGSSFWHQDVRGWYCSVPFVVELETEPTTGKWYPLDLLPEKTILIHRKRIIPPAVQYWKS